MTWHGILFALALTALCGCVSEQRGRADDRASGSVEINVLKAHGHLGHDSSMEGTGVMGYTGRCIDIEQIVDIKEH